MSEKAEYLERFKTLYRERNGVDLPEELAAQHFEQLIGLVGAIYQPIPAPPYGK